jgi:hypothetical protein
MRTLISRVLLAATLTTAFATACGYDPQPVSGMLHCSPQSTCPDGYTCRSTLCVRDGAGGSGGSGGGGSGGSGSVDKFVGRWTFNADSMRVRVCTDGVTNETIKPWDDFFDVTVGGASPLTTSYYCPWNLDVNAAGTATTLRPGTSCSLPSTTDPTTTFTWRAESFTLTTTNGSTGTLDASIPYTYVGTVTGNGSCTMHFTGSMTKS